MARCSSNSFDAKNLTKEDVHAVIDTLLSLGLSFELATLIINFSEYWCVQNFSSQAPLHMGPSYKGQRLLGDNSSPIEASSLYLQTGPLGLGSGISHGDRFNPKKITFCVTSQAESDSIQPGRDGTFLNQSSWLDAAIIREDETWLDTNKMEPAKALMRSAPNNEMLGLAEETESQVCVPWYLGLNPFELPPWFVRGGDRNKMKGGYKLVPHGSRLMWLLQRNRISSSELVERFITWGEDVSLTYEEVGEKWWTSDWDLKPPQTEYESRRQREWENPLEIRYMDSWKNGISLDGPEAKDEEWPIDGAGNGKDFVKTLRRGDRIGIWARTLWPEAENHVQSVTVTVYYSIV
ncbi:hypothetical protein BT63DRAFT_246314 [Microthyrium microscopicum]|uniref:Uncharacterized protein n=1 Tax=Microthyrium microscopicum TaxID=703497 RepID=A0A6A6UBF1_9PEZI|nr:hypothetical protein BT63DRAFT_246314 [Microthyrium microscopicum]